MQCLYPSSDLLTVSIKEQTLSYRGQVFPVSTSLYGVGSQEGSNKTPSGLFQVSEMFGAGDPIYSCYKGRQSVGVWDFHSNGAEVDGILSRIIRLSGLEQGNHNTYQRYIYIHGTNDEDGVGQERSIGCVRMKNLDIITLYNQVSLGTMVRIDSRDHEINLF